MDANHSDETSYLIEILDQLAMSLLRVERVIRCEREYWEARRAAHAAHAIMHEEYEHNGHKPPNGLGSTGSRQAPDEGLGASRSDADAR